MLEDMKIGFERFCRRNVTWIWTVKDYWYQILSSSGSADRFIFWCQWINFIGFLKDWRFAVFVNCESNPIEGDIFGAPAEKFIWYMEDLVVQGFGVLPVLKLPRMIQASKYKR